MHAFMFRMLLTSRKKKKKNVKIIFAVTRSPIVEGHFDGQLSPIISSYRSFLNGDNIFDVFDDR